jgi:hypothetical protein
MPMNSYGIYLKWFCEYICEEEILVHMYWVLCLEMKTIKGFHPIGAN